MKYEEAILNAKQELFNQFRERPYDFFNERDAISRFLAILQPKCKEIFEPLMKPPAHLFSMLHEEYPIPQFVKNPFRGRYDIVILNETYIQENLKTPYELSRPGDKRRPKEPKGSKAFHAVIEFKFLYEAPGRKDEIESDLIKLEKVKAYTEYCCLIYLQRLIENKTSWENHEKWIRNLANKKGVTPFIMMVEPKN